MTKGKLNIRSSARASSSPHSTTLNRQRVIPVYTSKKSPPVANASESAAQVLTSHCSSSSFGSTSSQPAVAAASIAPGTRNKTKTTQSSSTASGSTASCHIDWPPSLMMTPSSPSDLYCGAVYVVHSYLSFPELLCLSRTCRYYRNVATGLITPSGLRRLGHEIPFIAFDASAAHQTAMAMHHPLADARDITWQEQRRKRMPSFITLARAAAQKHLVTNSASVSPPAFDVQSVLAMTASPDHGIPSSSRRVTFTPYLESLNALLLSPIIGRHVQELVIRNSHTLTESELALIAIRFPFLQLLHMESLSLANISMSVWDNLPSNWGMTNVLRIPAQLRSLVINRGISPPEAVQTFLQALPLQCPLLRELGLGSSTSMHCDLAPLLSLPLLTRLALPPPRKGYGADPMTHHGAIVQQLTQLEYLCLFNLRDPLPVQTYVSTSHLRLRELPGGTFKDAVLLAIADRTPQLFSLNEGDVYPWLLIDHTVLLKFHSLRTLYYSQIVVRFGKITAVGDLCIAAHGSLDAHVSHVLSVFSQMRSVTCLKLGDFYVPLTARSMHTNAAYFQSLGLSGGMLRPNLAELEAASADTRYTFTLTPAAAASSSSSSTELLFNDMSLHPVIQLAFQLPQLIELSLKSSSATHLPSLAFLAHLPHLQSLSLDHAHYLPVESLYDLHHVSSSLTHLSLIDCFPVDSHGRSIYLLHDILQPLQLSHTITQAVTVQFPKSMRNPSYQNSSHIIDNAATTTTLPTATVPQAQPLSDDSSSSVAVYAFNVPVPLVMNASVSSSSSSSTSSSAVISPRHNSWYEILRHPLPSNTTIPSKVFSPLELAQSDLHDSDFSWSDLEADEEMLKRYTKRSQRLKEADAKRRSPYLLIFDSFTACAPQSSNEELSSSAHLTSLLLPHLRQCVIQHKEPNQAGCCFTYERLQLPRHRLRSNKHEVFADELWLNQMAQKLDQLHEGYGLRMTEADRFDFILGCNLWQILYAIPTRDPLLRRLLE